MNEAKLKKMPEEKRSWFARLLEGIRNIRCFSGKDSTLSQEKHETKEFLLTKESYTPVTDRPGENPADPYIVDCVKKVKEVK